VVNDNKLNQLVVKNLLSILFHRRDLLIGWLHSIYNVIQSRNYGLMEKEMGLN
jgi:hypothetical protein